MTGTSVYQASCPDCGWEGEVAVHTGAPLASPLTYDPRRACVRCGRVCEMAEIVDARHAVIDGVVLDETGERTAAWWVVDRRGMRTLSPSYATRAQAVAAALATAPDPLGCIDAAPSFRDAVSRRRR